MKEIAKIKKEIKLRQWAEMIKCRKESGKTIRYCTSSISFSLNPCFLVFIPLPPYFLMVIIGIDTVLYSASKMMENMQADFVQSHQAGFVRYCLNIDECSNSKPARSFEQV